MRTKNLLTILVAIFALSSNAYAQTKEKDNSKENTAIKQLQKEVAEYKAKAESLQLKSDRLETENANHKKEIQSLENKVKSIFAAIHSYEDLREIRNQDKLEYQREVAKVKDDANKEVIALKSEISQKEAEIRAIENSKNKEIDKLKNELSIGYVKFANRTLYVPFAEDNINYGREHINKASATSQDVIEAKTKVLNLLNIYGQSHKELQTLIQKAQMDPEIDSPFAKESYKARYVKLIESMPYYKYYAARNSDWSIPYLDDQITKFLDIIKNHESGRREMLDLLLDPNYRVAKKPVDRPVQ